MKKSIILSVAALAVLSFTLQAQERKMSEAVWTVMDGVSVPLPPMEHPRLYIRPDGIEDLKSRMGTPEGKKILSRLSNLAVPRTAEEEAADTDRGFRYYFKMRGLTSRVQVDALNYLTKGDKASARAAITDMLDSLRNCSFGTAQDLSRASGVMLTMGAVVYDWCYPEFTPEERQAYVSEFIRIAGRMECGYPPKDNESIAGHLCEWMILRDMLSAGIAIYDEYPDMYNHVIKMLYKEYIPARRYIYSGHNYHQGTGYANVRLVNDFISLWTLDRMGAGSIYGDDMRQMMYDFIYRRRPDGQVMPAGDVNHNNRIIPTYTNPMMMAASYFSDPYLQAEFERKPSMEPHLLLMELLWRDFSLKGKAPDDLPLTMYSGSPFGWMIARTGWDKNCAMVEMKVNEQFAGNHQHLDGGAFQIYYKGPLALDTGFYQGRKGGYNSANNKNYTKRTIAHNSLLIYDPDEKFSCLNYGGADKTEFADNDGGQRMPGEKWRTCRSFQELLSDDFTVGKTLAHGFGPDAVEPDYSYLKGDITKAYSAKVKDVRRSFVFFNMKNAKSPAVLVVFDRVVSSNPAFRKYWLLHSIEEPEIKEGGFDVCRTRDGDSGKIQCDVLLPEAGNASISKVGGEGYEYFVFGKNYPDVQKAPDENKECGVWRVEVSPEKETAEDLFLNVLQLTSGDRKLPRAALVKGDGVVGAAFAGRAVTFSADGRRYGSATFSLPKSKTGYEVLVTDMEPGKYTVRSASGTFELTASEEEGTLWFSAAAGKVTVTRQ